MTWLFQSAFTPEQHRSDTGGAEQAQPSSSPFQTLVATETQQEAYSLQEFCLRVSSIPVPTGKFHTVVGTTQS